MTNQTGNDSSRRKHLPVGRFVLVLVVVVLCVAAIWVGLNWYNIRAFQAMPSGAYAKFVCSSLFVIGMDEASAKEWASIPVPVQEVQIDYQGKTVIAKALLHSSVAQYQGERLGCTLQ